MMENQGNNKLTWRERIGLSSGELAQNLIYQTVSIWLLFFYTNVYGLKPEVAAVMFLVVRIIDIIWDPIVGAFVDKSNLRWGKYRSWLIIGGILLAAFAILCFWNGFSGSLLYAYITYVGMSMCFTLVNVPYGSIQASVTRDPEEITLLTTIRMLFANFGGLVIKTLPLVIAIFAPKVLNPDTGKMEAVYNTPEAGSAWFITMTIFALIGLGLFFFCFAESKERIAMNKEQTATVKVSDLFNELVQNRQLRILSFFFIVAFITMSVSNAADSYFMTYNINATPFMTTVFMWLGTIPAFILLPLVPAMKRKFGQRGMFRLFLIIAIAGMALMYVFVSIPSLKACFPLLCLAQLVKSSGILVATGYIWALVPDVVTYGEYLGGRRIAGIVNAIICFFMKAGMALGGVIPGLVLSWVGFKAASQNQTPLAEQGILWLVTIIPALLFVLAIVIISKYELDDNKMKEIIQAIESRNNEAK